MRKALLLLAMVLLVGTAISAHIGATPGTAVKSCALCTLPSGLYCWADYGEPCTPPTGSNIIGHCTPSQASQFCPGHMYNPPAGPPAGPTPGTPTAPAPPRLPYLGN